jgi:hypothetical protein
VKFEEFSPFLKAQEGNFKGKFGKFLTCASSPQGNRIFYV